MNDMQETIRLTKSAVDVGSTRLLAIIRHNRAVVSEAITKELERRHKEIEKLKAEAAILWDVHAELIRDGNISNDG